MNEDEPEFARKLAHDLPEAEDGQGSLWHRALKELGLAPAVDPGAGAIQAEARTKLEDET